MAKYRKIDTRIWNDEKFRQFSDDAQLVFLFLLTHPHMTAIGAMRGTIQGLAAEKGWPEKRFRKGFEEPFLKGMVKLDEKASFIWLPNFIKYNPPDNPNVVKSLESALDLLPECPLKAHLIQHVKGFIEGLSEPFQKALPEPFRKGMPIQEQEQEQEQEQDLSPLNNPPHSNAKKKLNGKPEYTPGFLQWWGVYPPDRRVAKNECFAMWEEYGLEPRTDELTEKIERLNETSWKSTDPEDRKRIKTSKYYLKDERFDDDLVPLTLETAGSGKVSGRGLNNIRNAQNVINSLRSEPDETKRLP